MVIYSIERLKFPLKRSHLHENSSLWYWAAEVTPCCSVLQTHIHSAVLAGGVAIGYSARSINYPWIAMVLGLLASVIAILGSYCLQVTLKTWNWVCISCINFFPNVGYLEGVLSFRQIRARKSRVLRAERKIAACKTEVHFLGLQQTACHSQLMFWRVT